MRTRCCNTSPIPSPHCARCDASRGPAASSRRGDGDYAAFTWAPDSPLLTRWLDLYHRITAHNRAEANAGRYLLGWARRAGFTDVTASSSTWTFADPESRAWWGDLWADRVVQSSFAHQAVEYGFADRAELATIADAWRTWAAQPDGWFAVLHGEVLATA